MQSGECTSGEHHQQTANEQNQRLVGLALTGCCRPSVRPSGRIADRLRADTDTDTDTHTHIRGEWGISNIRGEWGISKRSPHELPTGISGLRPQRALILNSTLDCGTNRHMMCRWTLTPHTHTQPPQQPPQTTLTTIDGKPLGELSCVGQP